ncbi:hypothetical protein QBC43DRAFT_330632 [Cladorrhinum sp. PSN259]|nr:hypothetical protein QBC43DRAFT_330632 [Cladorrhinum sp. PSN259]
MAVKEPRGKVRRLAFKNWEYEATYPASEQNTVLHITNKLRVKDLRDLKKVHFEEDRMRAFASVYVRLHQVPDKSRERLEKWIEYHQEMVNGWNLGYFLNSPEDDWSLGLKPRKPGIPPEAVSIRLNNEEEKEEAEEEEKGDNQLNERQAGRSGEQFRATNNSHNTSQKRKRNSELSTVVGVEFPAQMVEKYSDELAGKSQQGYLSTELEAAGNAVKAIHSLITGVARSLDDTNNLKRELQHIVGVASLDLRRTTKAAEIVSELQEHLKKQGVPAEEDIKEEDIKEGDKDEARAGAKRAKVARDDHTGQPAQTPTSFAPGATSRLPRVPNPPNRPTQPLRGGPRRIVPGDAKSTPLSHQKTVKRLRDDDEDEDEDEDEGVSGNSPVFCRTGFSSDSDTHRDKTTSVSSISSDSSFRLVGRPDPEAPPSSFSEQARLSTMATTQAVPRLLPGTAVSFAWQWKPITPRQAGSAGVNGSSITNRTSTVLAASTPKPYPPPGSSLNQPSLSFSAAKASLPSLNNKIPTPTTAAVIAREAMKHYSNDEEKE